jgi:hypothetical protein
MVTAAIARTGDITTVVVADAASTESDAREPVVDLLASAVDRVCDTEAGGACSSSPALEPRLPVATGDAPTLLETVDLPPVPGIDLPWSGTRPTVPEVNPAATVCDRAGFTDGFADPTTRTFVIPDAGLPATFGLAQTSGRLSDQQVADGFVGTIADRLADCVGADLVTSAEVIGSGEYDSGRMIVWDLEVRVDEDDTVRVLMGVARAGNLVTQVGCVTASCSAPASASSSRARRADPLPSAPAARMSAAGATGPGRRASSTRRTGRGHPGRTISGR